MRWKCSKYCAWLGHGIPAGVTRGSWVCWKDERVRNAKLSSHPVQAGLPGKAFSPVWSLPSACTPCTDPVPISVDQRVLVDERRREEESHSELELWGPQPCQSVWGETLAFPHTHSPCLKKKQGRICIMDKFSAFGLLSTAERPPEMLR